MKNRIAVIGLTVLFLLSLVGAVYIVLNNRVTKTSSGISLPRVFSGAKIKNNGIGMVYLLGPIYQGNKSSVLASSGNPEQIVKNLRKLRKRDDIKAVVLRINSPGGSVASVQEIYEEILKVKKAGKTVIASMADVAASGGYYVAAAADRIVANPGTLTGSIGVIMELGNLQELFKKIGVKMEVIKSGKFKDSGSPHRSLTDEERNILQSVINDAYAQFVKAIMDGRRMNKEQVLAFANGRIFTGQQALDRGLIDKLGGKEDAIALAAEIAGIEGEPRIVEETERWSQILAFIDSRMPSYPLVYRDLFSGSRVRLDYMLE